MRSSRLAMLGALLVALIPWVVSPQNAPTPPFVQRVLSLDVTVDYAHNRLDGTARITLENWTSHGESQASFLLNRLMGVRSVHGETGSPLPFHQDVLRFGDDSARQVMRLLVDLPEALPPGKRTTIAIDYGGNLVGNVDIGWLYVKDHIDTTFTILRSDALAFPVIGITNDAANRRAPNVDFTYDATVTVPDGYVVATGGSLVASDRAGATRRWHYRTDIPSPFLNIAIARYDTLARNGLKVFFFPQDSTGARAVFSSAENALHLYEQWFGSLGSQPHPTIIEIPPGWGSQADIVGGIIQEGTQFKPGGNEMPLYHELSHLWNVRDTDSPSPRWNEGLAMFLQLLTSERLDGWHGRHETLVREAASLRESAAHDSTLRTTPFAHYGSADMTDWSYSVGQLMFGVLYEIEGDGPFQRIVGGYFQQYRAGGTTRDFVAYAERMSSHNLALFFDDWLDTTHWVGLLGEGATAESLAARYR